MIFKEVYVMFQILNYLFLIIIFELKEGILVKVLNFYKIQIFQCLLLFDLNRTLWVKFSSSILQTAFQIKFILFKLWGFHNRGILQNNEIALGAKGITKAGINEYLKHKGGKEKVREYNKNNQQKEATTRIMKHFSGKDVLKLSSRN